MEEKKEKPTIGEIAYLLREKYLGKENVVGVTVYKSTFVDGKEWIRFDVKEGTTYEQEKELIKKILADAEGYPIEIKDYVPWSGNLCD